MTVLLDTNILTRLADSKSTQSAVAAASVSVLLNRGDDVHIVPQNLYEFWTVATRPLTANGLGMTPVQAKLQIDAVRLAATLLPDNAAITDEWERIVVRHDVRGKVAHDARLVAAMTVHGVKSLLTFNGADFVRYPGIVVIDPFGLAKPGSVP
jgi:predicted nucleic acid-binding protein